MKKKIRPSSNIIDSIGKNLIVDEISAIIELIKNSYDADAEKVYVKFSCSEEGLIIKIEDDGHGMDFETVENTWMVPATNYKKENKYSLTKKRRVLGEKGLGRYSVAILGEYLTLETVKNNKKTILELDWEEIKKVEYLDQIEFDINEKETIENNNTKLIIKKKKYECWNIAKKRQFEKELKKLLSPVENEEDIFKIYLEFENFIITNKENKQTINSFYEIAPFSLFEYYDYRLVANTTDDYRIEYKLYSKNNQLEKEGTLENIVQILEDKGEGFPGKFSIEFRFFNRDQSEITNLKELLEAESKENMGRLEVRKLLDELSGVSIYKNKFRIRPYGEESYDWLELNRRRFLNPTMRISNNQLNGVINLFDNTILIEKSARDGLQEDRNFFGLKTIALELLNILEIQRSLNKKKHESNGNENNTEKLFFNNLGNFNNVKKEIKNKMIDEWEMPENRAKEIEKIIDEKEATDLKEVKKISEIISKYEKHITLGKIVNRVLHEGRKPVNFFQNGCNYLDREVPKYLKNPQKVAEEGIKNKILQFREQTSKLIRLFKSIDPLSSKKKTNAKNTNLKEIIVNSLEVYESEMKKLELKLELKDVCSIVNGDEIQSAITNILENSLYWLNKSNRPKKITIKLYKNKDDKGIIEIKDSGPGILEEYIKSGIVFEPGFTGKVDGTGLGLSIAGEALKRNGFQLKIKYCDDGAHLIMEEKTSENIYIGR